MFSEGTENQNDDVDALLESVSSQSYEVPMSESVPEAPSPETAPQPKEWELDWNGQKIKADEDKFRKWAQQGYDYNQKMSSFNQKQQDSERAFQQKQQEWETKYSPYREIDQYVKENPSWWDHVEKSYQQAQNPPQAQIPDELKSYLDPIVKDYSQVKDFIQDYQRQVIEQQARQQEEQAKQHDTQLDGEIKSISQKYNLDFAQQDESGQSLEARVLNHALQNGIPTFKSAFLDYYHENLEKLAESRGKESAMNDIKKRKQLGLLGESSTPTRAKTMSPSGPRGKYEGGEDILREFNL